MLWVLPSDAMWPIIIMTIPTYEIQPMNKMTSLLCPGCMTLYVVRCIVVRSTKRSVYEYEHFIRKPCCVPVPYNKDYA